jgi:hypothetical protein
MQMLGFPLLVPFVYGVMSALANRPPDPPEERTGPYHWHVVAGGKRKYYFEEIGTSHDGYPKLQCPFCETEYVKRP